ncbi:MAG: nucleotidyltransferase [Clostridiaceae bacterium]|nr:nucleotidyltransferase [Clostridiaceae bacterium]
MFRPILVVLAAGMGSRYGGLKQIDPVGPNGEVIIDYSLYDAKRAGFETVVFIIKEEIEAAFKEAIGNRIEEYMEVRYAFQELTMFTEEAGIPEGRERPWGTSHAVLCAAEQIDAPFAVINADDYYGPGAYKLLYEFLRDHADSPQNDYCMVGYRLANTLTDHGTVSRGICSSDANDYLQVIDERKKIEKVPGGGRFTEDEGASWEFLPDDTLVSMNMWGFTPAFLGQLKELFPEFLRRIKEENPLRGEFYLPAAIAALLADGRARVKVLSSPDRWFGVTYREDKPRVMEALAAKHAAGEYPTPLWQKAVDGDVEINYA